MMDVWDGLSPVRKDSGINRAPAGWDYLETIYQIQQTQIAVNTGGVPDPQTAINTAAIAVNVIDIAANAADIVINAADIATNVIDIAANVADIIINAGNIATNVINIAANAADIATNAGNIATNTGDIATNTLDISNLTTTVSINTGNILINTNAIAALETSLDGNAYEKTGWDETVWDQITIAFDEGTRTASITPVGASASYYISGTKYTFTTTQSVVIDDTEGTWYIFFSGSTLTASQTTWYFDETKCFVISMYWDATNNNTVGFAPEMHSWEMPDRTHGYLHETCGARWANGLGVAEATSSTVNVAAGVIYDEDIRVRVTDELGSGWWDQVLSPLTAPIFYRTGAGDWRKFAASTALCYIDTTVPQVNIYSGTWQWSAVSVNRYFAYWVVASTNKDCPIYIVPGQEDADKLSDAISENALSNMAFDGLPTEEHKIIARLILKRTVASPYYEITQIDDYRSASSETSGAGTTVSDHGGLTGLSDDDHVQYQTEARANTWIAANHETNFVHPESQATHAGEFLTTDGSDSTDPTWAAIRQVTTGGVSGQVLTTDGSGYAWVNSAAESDTLDDVCDRGSTTDQGITAGSFATAGNIQITVDNSKLVFGAGNDYDVCWNGTNAQQAIKSGAFIFDGGAVRDPSFTTTERNALTPANGDTIYNSTDNQFQVYENGGWISWSASIATNTSGLAAIDLQDVCANDPATTYEIQAGGFKSTAHFHCFADTSKHYFGAGDDYQIYYDGTDAQHYLVAGTGSYKFNNGAIGVATFSTVDRDTYITSPYEGMLIYNLNTNTLQVYVIAAASSWENIGSGNSILPAQSGHGGEYLTTDGTTPSWASVAGTTDTLDNVCDRGSSTDQTITAGSFTTTGSITNDATDSKHYFGASNEFSIYWNGTNARFDVTSGAFIFNAKVVSSHLSVNNDTNGLDLGIDDDYNINWDGSDAIHTITAGSFIFTGGPIELPVFTTTERDLLTPANGMVIYNTTDSQIQHYENGSWVYKPNTTIIESDTDVYITTGGNDTTGDGSSGTPWASIDKALAVVGTWVIVGDNFVTINIAAGDYSSATTDLDIFHINGRNISIEGDYSYDQSLAFSSISGSSGNYLITFTVTDSSIYTVGKPVNICVAGAGTNPEHVRGVHLVSSIPNSTSVILNSRVTGTLTPSGAVIAYASIPNVRWSREVNIYSDLDLLIGIENRKSHAFAYAPLFFNVEGNIYVRMHHVMAYNTDTSGSFGGGRVFFKQSTVDLQQCSCYRGYGFYLSSAHVYAVQNTGEANSVAFYITATSDIKGSHNASMVSNYACYAIGMSSVDCAYGMIVGSLTADLAPAHNTTGNRNSFMYWT